LGGNIGESLIVALARVRCLLGKNELKNSSMTSATGVSTARFAVEFEALAWATGTPLPVVQRELDAKNGDALATESVAGDAKAAVTRLGAGD
jgi:hypothetical protein